MHSDVFRRKKATEKKQKSSLFSINSVLCCGQWSNRNGARGAPWTRSLPVSPPPHHPPHSRSSDDVRELGSPRPPPRRRGRVGPAPPAVSRDARTTRSSSQATDPQKSARRCPLTKPKAGPNRRARSSTRSHTRPDASRRTRLAIPFARRARESPSAKPGECLPRHQRCLSTSIDRCAGLPRRSKAQRHNLRRAACALTVIWRSTGERQFSLFEKLTSMTLTCSQLPLTLNTLQKHQQMNSQSPGHLVSGCEARFQMVEMA